MINIALTKVKIGRKIILEKINLKVLNGQVLAVLGRNGTGKSTLLNALTKHPAVTYTGAARMDAPVFMGFQKPVEVPEITTIELLLHLHLTATGEPVDSAQFYTLYSDTMTTLELDTGLLERPLNTGVSGGENKRIELLQMTVLKPKTLLLDEVDTGLDLDSQILIGNYLAGYIKKHKPAVVVVSHNMKFLSYFKCNQVVILADGHISQTGDKLLIKTIDRYGFSGLSTH
jgi:Fe-S cluster assembly ATP-binding protein